jgi:hypothetical protein
MESERESEESEAVGGEMHDLWVDAMNSRLQGGPTAADLGVALQYMKAIGTVAQVAAEVAQNPTGPVATGVGRILPFVEQAEDPDEMAG